MPFSITLSFVQIKQVRFREGYHLWGQYVTPCPLPLFWDSALWYFLSSQVISNSGSKHQKACCILTSRAWKLWSKPDYRKMPCCWLKLRLIDHYKPSLPQPSQHFPGLKSEMDSYLNSSLCRANKGNSPWTCDSSSLFDANYTRMLELRRHH